MALIESFWTQHCPERGPALPHAHSIHCSITTRHPGLPDTDHIGDQCCHCGVRAADWYQAQERIREQTTPPAQVGWPGHEHIFQNGKCATCPATDPGLPTTKPMDDIPVEPKAITGKGPQGRETAPGRGPLEQSDERRLQFYVAIIRESALEEAYKRIGLVDSVILEA